MHCPSRWCTRAEDGHLALRACLAHSSGKANDWNGLHGQLPRGAGGLAREARSALLSQADRALASTTRCWTSYEPGMTLRHRWTACSARRGNGCRASSSDVVAHARRARPVPSEPVGPFPLDQASVRCASRWCACLGFDFEAGRLDVSTHPFCGGVPEDVRMTTRFREDDFLGQPDGHHPRNRPWPLRAEPAARPWISQPVSRGAQRWRIHESQSLSSFEMQLGSHPGFVAAAGTTGGAGLRRRSLPLRRLNLQKLLTRVKPGFIRVEADEVTYAAHIILRYEIERPLIEGEPPGSKMFQRCGTPRCMELLGRGHTRQLQVTARCRTCTGPKRCSATSPATHWARCTPRSGLRPCAAPGPGGVPDVDGCIARWRARAGVRLAAREHLEPGQPLDHRRAGRARQRRGAEPGALQGAPRGQVSGVTLRLRPESARRAAGSGGRRSCRRTWRRRRV